MTPKTSDSLDDIARKLRASSEDLEDAASRLEDFAADSDRAVIALAHWDTLMECVQAVVDRAPAGVVAKDLRHRAVTVRSQTRLL